MEYVVLASENESVVRGTSNDAPVFIDQDTGTAGIQNTETTREVDEGKKGKPAGDAVLAADDEALLYSLGGPSRTTRQPTSCVYGEHVRRARQSAIRTRPPTKTGDTLTYSLSGSDYFEIDDMGQISTTMMLDHEAMASHMVTITATDSDEGATDTHRRDDHGRGRAPGLPGGMDNMGLTNDCEALLDAKGDLGGDLNWDTDTAMADWEGVTMSDGRVSGIWLKDEGLDGSVSAALGRLDMLTVLNLHSNSLSGTIPDLSGATMLEELYLREQHA